MAKYVYIVYDVDLGWDNIIAVFTKERDAIACVENRGDTSGYHTEILNDPDFKDGIYIG